MVLDPSPPPLLDTMFRKRFILLTHRALLHKRSVIRGSTSASCIHIGCILQHTATHCNTLQHTATHSNTLQHCNTSKFCIIATKYERFVRFFFSRQQAQYVAICCGVLQCFSVCCSMLQCVAACCSVLQRGVVCTQHGCCA